MNTPLQILDYCQHCETLIAQEIPDDTNLLKSYGDELSAWLSTMARCVADARLHHRNGVVAITNTVMQDEHLRKMTPMVMNKYIGAAAGEYAYIEDMADRMYSALTKRLSWVITQVSYNKVELSQLNNTR